MVRPIHHKLHPRRNLAEFSDNQLIGIPRIQMRHMTFEIAIGNVSEITHDNLRILERRFHVNFLVVARNRVDRHRIREYV